MFCMQTICSTETFGGEDVNMFVDADGTQCQCVTWSSLMVTDLTCFSHLRANQYLFLRKQCDEYSHRFFFKLYIFKYTKAAINRFVA